MAEVSLQQWREWFLRHVAPTSQEPLGLAIERARGAWVYTLEGEAFLDFLAGIGVANIGHTHPEVVAAIREQAEKYLHTMVYGEYIQAPQVLLARELAHILPPSLSVVYFTNSGTEAIEGALKVAKKFTGRRRLVAFEGSYHGDTHGSLSVTGGEVYRRPFLPLLPEVTFLPFDEVKALSAIDEEVAGVIVEPIQAEGGVQVPKEEFLLALRRRCDEVGALLLFDEVQTGFGRTGKLFAFEHWGVVPDVLCLAKALGGGMPLGAFVSRPEVMHTLAVNPPLSHVTTFGGHPVCCAAGLAGLRVLLRERLPERAALLGQRLLEALRELPGRGIREVRGKGLLVGIEFENETLAQAFVRNCLKHRLIVGVTLHIPAVVRLAPPLSLTQEELEEGLHRLRRAWQETV